MSVGQLYLRLGSLMLVLLMTVTLGAQEVSDGIEGPTVPQVAIGDSGEFAEVEQTRERINPLWIAGLVTWGTMYISTAIVSGALAEPDVKGTMVAYGLIPIVGPFIAVANDRDDVIVDGYVGPLVFSGIAQIACVGLFITGLLLKRDVSADETALTRQRRLARPSFALTAGPIGHGGVAAVFSFTHI